MIVLLDLNYTLVENSEEKAKPFTKQIEGERYRQWLVDLVKPHTVLLLTARPAKYGPQTIESIWKKTGWMPQGCKFNSYNLPPHQCKREMLGDFVFPKFGKDPAQYFAIESNPATRAMYRAHGIAACPHHDAEVRRVLGNE